MSDHVLEHLTRDLKQLKQAYKELEARVSAIESPQSEPVKRGPGRPKKATNEAPTGN